MHLKLKNIRCFEHVDTINFSTKLNIFIGQNNSGKSTILSLINSLQLPQISAQDARPGENLSSGYLLTLRSENPNEKNQPPFSAHPIISCSITIIGNPQFSSNYPVTGLQLAQPVFARNRPLHRIVPFFSKRKAVGYSESVTSASQEDVTGNLNFLYSRIDLLANYGHPAHEKFKEAVSSIIGINITTKASQNGKIAGYYFGTEFISIDKMGDGISEMMALIVELCIEEGKIFVLEEPETNIHPNGLKLIAQLIAQAAEKNQFIIATHSNIILRELGSLPDSKVFRVFREGPSYEYPSNIEEVPNDSQSHMQVLRELGYDFADFGLHGAWLFLEESSAESIISQILIPFFVPELAGVLRTYSSNGVANLAKSVSEFHRLLVFVHLQPVYQNRFWLRADGDPSGLKAVDDIRDKFPKMGDDVIGVFAEHNFENYYPKIFTERVEAALQNESKVERKKLKAELVREVISWSLDNEDQSKANWEETAQEIILFLKFISEKLKTSRPK